MAEREYARLAEALTRMRQKQGSADEERFVVDKRGEPQAVIMNLAQCQGQRGHRSDIQPRVQ